ncbi:MAG: hypothetical protein EZS28_043246, partial [Streblomastix strix]
RQQSYCLDTCQRTKETYKSRISMRFRIDLRTKFFRYTIIPIISKIISYLNIKITIAIVIALWWLGQPRLLSMVTQSNKYLILEKSSQCLVKGLSMENTKKILPPGKIAAFLLDQKWIIREWSQFTCQIEQDFLEELSNCQSMNKDSRFMDSAYTQ